MRILRRWASCWLSRITLPTISARSKGSQLFNSALAACEREQGFDEALLLIA